MPTHPIYKTVKSLLEQDESKLLHLTFGSKKVTSGEQIPKQEAQVLPNLAWNTSPGQKFIVITLDIDAPVPSFACFGPVLHWLQAGLTNETSNGDLTSSDPVIAFWAGPGPPPFSGPHRYIFLLYDQPADFETEKYTKPGGYNLRDRARWDLSKFEREARLGPVVAANYFFSN